MLLKEFICLPDATPLLMTIGCCYHKMADIDSWPMSNAVRMSLSRLKNPWKPSRSAFRLACQQRMSSWKNIIIVECFYKELGIAGQAQERGFNRKMGNSQLELESSILRKNNITCHQQADLWRSKFRQISAQHQHIAEFVEHSLHCNCSSRRAGNADIVG
uniref:Uncharacterized protein n=1 Tax=Ditylenchus dipsaci TaxID=166011 RepID=A0A915DC70_9BILA